MFQNEYKLQTTHAITFIALNPNKWQNQIKCWLTLFLFSTAKKRRKNNHLSNYDTLAFAEGDLRKPLPNRNKWTNQLMSIWIYMAHQRGCSASCQKRFETKAETKLFTQSAIPVCIQYIHNTVFHLNSSLLVMFFFLSQLMMLLLFLLLRVFIKTIKSHIFCENKLKCWNMEHMGNSSYFVVLQFHFMLVMGLEHGAVAASFFTSFVDVQIAQRRQYRRLFFCFFSTNDWTFSYLAILLHLF